jgi:hypothetical protein
MHLLSAPEVEEYLATGWHRVNTIPPPAALLSKIRFQCFALFSLVFFTFSCAVYTLLSFVKDLVEFWPTWPIEYDRYLREIFHDETKNQNTTSEFTVGLPVRTKVCIIFLFLMCSACYWAGVLLNLSLLNALIAPDWRLIPTVHGEIIAEGTILMACAALGQLEPEANAHVLRLLLVAPALCPFIMFVFIHLRALTLSHMRMRSLTTIDDDIATRTKNIASKMNVPNICCVLDRQSRRISPYAVVRGFRRKNIIVFTKRSLEFLSTHPEHADAVLAHEVAHLKHDCLMLWKLRLLSRLSLTGVGFLSVLCDSIAMEDRADNAARRYLLDSEKDENLLTESAFMLELQDNLDSGFYGPESQIVTGFFQMYDRSHVERSPIKGPFLRRFYTALRIAHDIYFWVDLYDYVHRQARYRRTPSNLYDKA